MTPQDTKAKKTRQNTRDQTTIICTSVMAIVSAMFPDIPDGATEGMTGLLIVMTHRAHHGI
ncbi:hypothetical protein CMI37_37505 [Candidatus Pacearchaeota archaeon]|nr:hypothetical protein [Candidatus Pacearchaeota archaeon]